MDAWNSLRRTCRRVAAAAGSTITVARREFVVRSVLAIVIVLFIVVMSVASDPALSDDQPRALVSPTSGRVIAAEEERTQMKNRADAAFKLESWDEKPYNEIEGAPKLTRVKVTKTYHGDIEGESTLEYLMMYRQDGTASFVGLERVVGSLGGRSGTFVLQHKGTFEGGKAKVECFVVSGSGTGELSGIRGEGGFAAGHAEQHAVTLDYDFE